MKFVHPHVLYFLLLLIIPIIIHLFNFRRYKKLYFSSLSFIKKVEKETNSKRNIRHLVILFTRLLAFTALILAFAQPYSPKDGEVNTINSVVPIYLDNSFSMSAKGDNGDLLNQAKATITQIADNYPKGQRYILVTNELDGSELRFINRTELNDRLDQISLSPISRSITNPLTSVKEYLSNNNFEGDVNYYLISDFQQRFMDESSPNVDTTANYSFLQLAPQIDKNLYIDSIWFEQPFQRINVNNTLNVRIQNTGKQKLTNVEVNTKVGSVNRQALIDLDANNNTIATINYTDKTIGVKEGLIEVMDENLYFDNKFYFSYEIKETVNVLIINEQGSTKFPQLVFETDDYYSIEQTVVDQLKIDALNKANLIVLNGLKTISSGLLTQINQLVNNDLHVLLIPAANFDKNAYNNFLANFQLPLFNNATNQEIRIGKVMSELNFFTGMFDDKIDQLRMPPLKNYISSTTYSNANYNPLILYENGMPLLVEQAKSKNVFVLYTAIDPSFNDFGKSALFVSTLLRIGEISQGKIPLWLTIGSSDEHLIQNSSPTESAYILKQDNFEFIPEINRKSAFSSISVRHAIDNQSIRDGVYQIVNNDKEVGKIALNYNRLESDMNYASTNDINNYFKSIGIKKLNSEVISTLSDVHHLTTKKSNELWRILLILGLSFFIIEMALIIFWKV